MRTPFIVLCCLISVFWSTLGFTKETQNNAGSNRQPSTVGELPAPAQPQTPPETQQKRPDTGDIDMYQFKNLDEPRPSDRASTRRLPVEMTCTTPNGVVIKKGETGFDTCITNSQSRVLKQQHTPEAPDDPRTF